MYLTIKTKLKTEVNDKGVEKKCFPLLPLNHNKFTYEDSLDHQNKGNATVLLTGFRTYYKFMDHIQNVSLATSSQKDIDLYHDIINGKVTLKKHKKIVSILVIDIDIEENENMKSGLQFLEDTKDLINWENIPCSETGNGGRHYYFQWDNQCGKSRSRLIYNGNKYSVDVRGNGGLAILPPTKYKMLDGTKKKYEWIREINEDCSNLPQITGLLRKILLPKEKAYIKPIYSTSPNCYMKQMELHENTKEHIEYLLNSLPIEEITDIQWFGIGYKLKPYGEAGLKLFDEFSSRSTHYDKTRLMEKWKIFKPTPNIVFYLRHLLKLHDESKYKNYKKEFDILPISEYFKENIFKIVNTNDEDCNLSDLQKQEKLIFKYFNQYFSHIIMSGKPTIIECKIIKRFNPLTQNIVYKRIPLVTRDIKNTIEARPVLSYLMTKWLKYEYRSQYHTVDFLPNQYDKRIFNMFTGFKAEPSLTCNKESIEKILNHINVVYCNKDEQIFDYVMKWLAHIIQKPNIKLGKAIVVTGEQGVGKTRFFTDFIQAQIIGDELSYHTPDITNVTGRFNSSLSGKILTILDEIKAHSTTHDVWDLFKSLVTDSKRNIEAKYKDNVSVKDYNNYIFISNHSDIIKIEPNDRRYLILKASSVYKGNEEYFKGIEKLFTDEQVISNFMKYLLDIDISNFGPTTPVPITEEKRELTKLCAPKEILFFSEKLYNKLKRNIEKNDTYIVCVDDIFNSYTEWCKQSGYRGNSTKITFNRILKNTIPSSIYKRVRTKTHNGYIFQFNKQSVKDLEKSLSPYNLIITIEENKEEDKEKIKKDKKKKKKKLDDLYVENLFDL